MVSRKVLKILLVILAASMFLPQVAYSAFEEKPAFARTLGMGGVAVGLADDVSSIYHNPSGLARLHYPEFGTTYTTLFGLEELRYNNLAYAQPLGKLGGLGLAWEGFGGEIYKERIAFASYARKIFKGTYLGINFKYMELSIETVGRGTDLGLDLGLLQEFGPKVNLGLFWQNMNNPRIGEALPSKISAGIALKPVERIILALDYRIIETPIKESFASLAVGSEVELTRYFLLRAGIQSEPQRVTFGFGIHQKWAGFDYAYLTHHVLGGTHQLSLILRFGKR